MTDSNSRSPRSVSHNNRRRTYSSTQKYSNQPRRTFDGGARGGFRSNSGRPSFSRNNRGGFRGGRRGNRTETTFDVSKFINLNPVKSSETEEHYEAKNTFFDFKLDESLTKAIVEAGYTSPTPIQDQVIPLILDDEDVIGLAQTGTGKTAAFLIPTIEKTLKNKNLLTLILTPTRELAIQIEQELRKLTPKMGIYSTVCVGGTSIVPQIKNLKKRNHFIIGTPGRVQDLIDRKHIKPSMITNVILDEADRMLDMGFIHDIRNILKFIPDERNTLFFSATMSKTIEGLVDEFLKNPEKVSVRKKDVASSVSQDVVRCNLDNKFDTLVCLLKEPAFSRVIIFGAMKHQVEKLSQALVQSGIQSDAIHGDKSHSQRQHALRRFKSGQVKVLVATDVASRGIHVDDVSHVINYDLPNTYEDYIHRIGRTGRGDKHGQALTFVQN